VQLVHGNSAAVREILSGRPGQFLELLLHDLQTLRNFGRNPIPPMFPDAEGSGKTNRTRRNLEKDLQRIELGVYPHRLILAKKCMALADYLEDGFVVDEDNKVAAYAALVEVLNRHGPDENDIAHQALLRKIIAFQLKGTGESDAARAAREAAARDAAARQAAEAERVARQAAATAEAERVARQAAAAAEAAKREGLSGAVQTEGSKLEEFELLRPASRFVAKQK
jgi:hypothetical protein